MQRGATPICIQEESLDEEDEEDEPMFPEEFKSSQRGVAILVGGVLLGSAVQEDLLTRKRYSDPTGGVKKC